MLKIGPARSSTAGPQAALFSCIGVACCMFGFFLTMTGIILTATASIRTFQTDFFEESNNAQRSAGIAVLVIGLILIITGIVCCVIMCKKANEAKTAAANAPQTTVVGGGQPLVTGSVPLGPAYTTGAYQPQGVQSGYQPQAGQYPPPAGQYPPPAGQYPPPQSQYPPPTNPNYPANNYDGSAVPPPAYSDVVDKN